jgi:multiple sugar transport system substrate-binding protein/putative aldouronate transport system substrate-binding protein
MRKRLALFLAVVMAASAVMILGGCRNRSDELIEIVIYSQTANSSGAMVGWSAEVLKEKFGVKVTIIPERSGTYSTRMASRDLGDIVIWGGSGNQYQDAVSAGLLLDWEKDDLLKEEGPYIYEHMQKALQKNRELSGGGLYGFGFDVAVDANDHDAHIYYPYLRWDLYEQLGKPEINTLEDFIPVLEGMKQLEPFTPSGAPTYGVSSFGDWDEDMVMMVKSTAALYGWEEFGFGLYNVITQEFQGCLEDGSEYLRALRFYNQLNQKGLFDPDSMTQTFDEVTAKYKNGVSFFNIFTFVAETFNSIENLEAGRSLQCIPAADQLNLVNGLNEYGKNRIWSIGASTKYPELVMNIINWFATPEGVLTYNYGPKGLTWGYNAEGNTYLTDIGMQAQRDKRNTTITYGDWTGIYKDGEFQHNLTTWSRDTINPESALGETYNWDFWKSTFDSRTIYPVQQRWHDWADGARTADEFLRNEKKVAVSLGTPFEIAARDTEVDVIWAGVATAIKNGSWRAIYAKSDQEFNFLVGQMVSEAKRHGYDQCIAWIETQAQRRREAEDKVKNNG